VALTPLPTGVDKRRMVRAMFDRIAPRYDALNRVMTAGLDQRWRRAALSLLGVGPGDVVVDVACGTGDFAELARARGARAIGVDMAGEMLRGARRRGACSALVQADAAALPLPDACASVVTCGFALRNFESLAAPFAEMARVLVPGGRLALLEVDRPRRALVRAGHAFYFDHMVPWLGGLLSDRAAYAYLPRSVAYLPEEADLLALVANAGFTRVARRSYGLGAVQLVTAVREGDGQA
jgi:demethylmenaquinone methyltransferase/2-methoxy-6-polyprenyl-1,4-benzoquinol methylase